MSALLNNRYRILQTLGSGGCGKTFLVEDAHMPSKRRCVIKQLKPTTNDLATYQVIQERFQREAATLEMLGISSDQIPTLHAYFTEAEEFYLVQDWVDGKSLMQKVKEEGAFSESQVKEILLNLLPVLDYIHSQGIIHRDIKPENIMLRERDGKPVLIDFGAVKEVVATIVDIDGSSTSSIVIGSPGFMPLEQAAGKPVFASDLYSLGLTAIYLLTGKRPKELTDLLTGDISWRKYVANVSSELAAILDKAIQPLARERYHTAREMLEALQSINDDSDLTIPAKRASSRVSLSTSSSSSIIQKSATWIRILIWGGVGFISGLISTLLLELRGNPVLRAPMKGLNLDFALFLSPGIVFGTAIYLFGEYSSSSPVGKRKRIFSYIVLTVVSALGWYCASEIGEKFGDNIVGFSLASMVGSAFISTAELLCWRFAFRRWTYPIVIIIIAGLSGSISLYVFGKFESLYMFFAFWQATVLSAHIIALKITREHLQGAK